MPRKSIVWLASYPKSGNTWVRIFLANYLFNRRTPLPINEAHRLGMGDSIEGAYRMVAGSASDGSRGSQFDIADPRQSLALRGKVLSGIVNNDADLNFVKTHNHRTKAFGVGLIPPHLTRSAIYILRNPLDMVMSYARHYGLTPEFTAGAVSRRDNIIAGADSAVTQFLGSWSDHVKSWARCRDFPVLVLRYEDMQADPDAAFTRALKHLGVPADPVRVARAVRFSSFGELRKQEDETGFIERSPNSEKFFHSGNSGQWRGELPEDVVARFTADHNAVMKRYGYLAR